MARRRLAEMAESRRVEMLTSSIEHRHSRHKHSRHKIFFFSKIGVLSEAQNLPKKLVYSNGDAFFIRLTFTALVPTCKSRCFIRVSE